MLLSRPLENGLNYYLSWKHVIYSYMKGEIFFPWFFDLLAIVHITFWFNAYSTIKLFSFSTAFVRRTSELIECFVWYCFCYISPTQTGAYNTRMSFWQVSLTTCMVLYIQELILGEFIRQIYPLCSCLSKHMNLLLISKYYSSHIPSSCLKLQPGTLQSEIYQSLILKNSI